jgi:hypothetical protein
MSISKPNFEDYRIATRLHGDGGAPGMALSLSGHGQPEQINGEIVSATSPAHGATAFPPGGDKAGGAAGRGPEPRLLTRHSWADPPSSASR